MRRRLLAVSALLAASACERAAPPDGVPPAAPTPAASATPAETPDPRLRAPADDPDFGVVIGELRPPLEHGMLVLAFDLVAELERIDCDFARDVSGATFRVAGTPTGLHTAFVRGDATRWARRPVYVRPGEVTDLGVLELEPLPHEALVRGIVRDTEWRPLAGVEVSHPIGRCGEGHIWEGRHWSTRTTSTGEFALAAFGRDLSLAFRLDGYGARELDARPGDLVGLRLQSR